MSAPLTPCGPPGAVRVSQPHISGPVAGEGSSLPVGCRCPGTPPPGLPSLLRRPPSGLRCRWGANWGARSLSGGPEVSWPSPASSPWSRPGSSARWPRLVLAAEAADFDVGARRGSRSRTLTAYCPRLKPTSGTPLLTRCTQGQAHALGVPSQNIGLAGPRSAAWVDRASRYACLIHLSAGHNALSAALSWARSSAARL
jgi:hypothetical protein